MKSFDFSGQRLEWRVLLLEGRLTGTPSLFFDFPDLGVYLELEEEWPETRMYSCRPLPYCLQVRGIDDVEFRHSPGHYDLRVYMKGSLAAVRHVVSSH